MANEEIPDDLGEMSWSEIQSVVADVKHQLDNSSDGATHQVLRERLVEAREALAEIESRWEDDPEDTHEHGNNAEATMPTPTPDEAAPGSDDSIDELLAELLVDDASDETSEHDPEIIEAAIITARGKRRTRPPGTAIPNATDRQHAVASSGEGPGRPVADPAPTQRFTTASWVIGAFALTALAGTAGILLIGSRDAPDDEPVEVATAPAGDLEEFREVLAILDAGGLDVEWEGAVLQISGTVASSEQLDVVLDTAAVMVDYEDLDTSGVTVDEPLVVVAGDSASVSDSASRPVSPRDSLGPKLQKDLDRLLRTTPIMFEPGESELGELDRRILNAAVVLILSAPQADIVITGHADDATAGPADNDLATARATAVRDYLIARGVDPEVLSSRGQATLDPNQAPGVIELTVDPETSNP